VTIAKSEIADEARRVLAASFRTVVAAKSHESGLASENVNRIAKKHETQRRERQLVRCKAAGVMSAVDSQRRISRLL